MRKRLEKIKRIQYVVGYIILLTLRSSFFPTFEREMLGGNQTAVSSLSLGLLLLLALLTECFLQRIKIKPFVQNILAIGVGLVSIVVYRNELYLILFALSVGLLARRSKSPQKSSNKLLNGFIFLCSLLLFANFYWQLTWLYFSLLALVAVGSFIIERYT